MLGLSGCVDETTYRSVTLDIQPMWGDQPLTMDTDYSVGDKTINLDVFAMYLSDIEVIADGGKVVASKEVLLASNGRNNFGLGMLAVEDNGLQGLDQLRFSIGLDSIINHIDPLTAAAPLNDVGMHWNWNPMAGYKFVRMDGRLDGAEFASHAAGDPLYRSGVSVDLNQVSFNGDDILITLQVDMQNALDGVVFTDGNNHGPASPANQAYINKLPTGEPFSSK